MTDTPAAVCERYRALLMRRSGAERLRMGSDMFDAARTLVRASLGDPDGRDRSPELKARVFQRVYAGDLDPERTARVIAHLWRGDRKR